MSVGFWFINEWQARKRKQNERRTTKSLSNNHKNNNYNAFFRPHSGNKYSQSAQQLL